MDQGIWTEEADHLTPEAALLISEKLRLVVEQHQRAKPHGALHTWQELSLPANVGVWRELGIAVTNMQLADLDAASLALVKAELFDPENPLVFYFRGILHLEQAFVANEYFDAIEPDTFRFASYTPGGPTLRYSKSMYQLMAVQDMERAIELRHNIFQDETLLPSYLLSAENASPTVGDLLKVWKVENFAGQAHNILGNLCLERGLLEQAENHMDEAKASGASVIYGYRDLGARYEAEHRHGDAFRAYAKAVGEDPSVVAPTQGILRSIGHALGDLW